MSALAEMEWEVSVMVRRNRLRSLSSFEPGDRLAKLEHGDINAARDVDRSWIAHAVNLDPHGLIGIDESASRNLRRSKVSTAIHEASHLVTTEQICRPGALLACTIMADGASGVHLTRKRHARRDMLDQVGAEYLHAAIQFAGRLGELVAAGHQWDGATADWSQPDFWEGRDIFFLAAPEETREQIDIVRLMARAQQMALAVLDECWPRVIEVAQVLLDRGSFSTEVKAERQNKPPAVFSGLPAAPRV